MILSERLQRAGLFCPVILALVPTRVPEQAKPVMVKGDAFVFVWRVCNESNQRDQDNCQTGMDDFFFYYRKSRELAAGRGVTVMESRARLFTFKSNSETYTVDLRAQPQWVGVIVFLRGAKPNLVRGVVTDLAVEEWLKESRQ